MQRDVQHLVMVHLHCLDDHGLACLRVGFSFGFIDQIIEGRDLVIAPVVFTGTLVVAAMQDWFEREDRVGGCPAPAEHVHAGIEFLHLGKIVCFRNCRHLHCHTDF